MATSSTVPIYRDDDLERISELYRAAEQAERKAQRIRAGGAARAGDDHAAEAAEAWAAYEEYVTEAADRAQEWEVHKIGHAEFRDLLKKHPPRMVEGEGDEGARMHPEDASLASMTGVAANCETIGRPLLLFVDDEDPDIRTVHGPFQGDDLRRELKKLSWGEFEALWMRAFQINVGGVADPKATLSLIASRSSSAT